MKNKLSTEYAEALFALALEQGKSKEFFEELTLVNDILLSTPEYLAILVSPSITVSEKIDLVDKAFSSLDEMVLNFLKLLIEKGRISIFPLCLEEYQRLYDASRKTIVATVISAAELTDSEKAKIINKLEKKYGCKIELECQVDESILGGLIIKTEDSIIDGSLKKKLRDVKEVIRK